MSALPSLCKKGSLRLAGKIQVLQNPTTVTAANEHPDAVTDKTQAYKRSRLKMIVIVLVVAIILLIMTIIFFIVLLWINQHSAGKERTGKLSELDQSLLILGGATCRPDLSPNDPNTQQTLSSLELVDIRSPLDTACLSLPVFPLKAYGAIGTFMQGQAWACKGRRCFRYSMKDRRWIEAREVRMGKRRDHAATVMINEGIWWVTGGSARNSQHTSEVYIANLGLFLPFHNLPEKRYRHCLVKINASHYFLAGGYPYSNRTYLFNLNDNEWEQQAPMPQWKSGAVCGLVHLGTGSKEIVVAGGYHVEYVKSTYLYSLETQTWRDGLDLPFQLSGMASVPIDNTFLAIGGHEADLRSSSFQDFIYKFEYEVKGNERRAVWRKLPNRLNTARYYFAAFWVPKNLEEGLCK